MYHKVSTLDNNLCRRRLHSFTAMEVELWRPCFVSAAIGVNDRAEKCLIATQVFFRSSSCVAFV